VGNGDGSFASAVHFAVSVPGCVAVGDFNGDGRQDLVTSQSSPDVSVLLNTTAPPTIAANQAAVTVNEGTQVTNTGTFDDPPGHRATGPGNDAAGPGSWSYPPPDSTAGPIPVTITARDTGGRDGHGHLLPDRQQRGADDHRLDGAGQRRRGQPGEPQRQRHR